MARKKRPPLLDKEAYDALTEEDLAEARRRDAEYFAQFDPPGGVLRFKKSRTRAKATAAKPGGRRGY